MKDVLESTTVQPSVPAVVFDVINDVIKTEVNASEPKPPPVPPKLYNITQEVVTPSHPKIPEVETQEVKMDMPDDEEDETSAVHQVVPKPPQEPVINGHVISGTGNVGIPNKTAGAVSDRTPENGNLKFKIPNKLQVDKWEDKTGSDLSPRSLSRKSPQDAKQMNRQKPSEGQRSPVSPSGSIARTPEGRIDGVKYRNKDGSVSSAANSEDAAASRHVC